MRRCPFPINGDDGTASQCVQNKHCGCDEGFIRDLTLFFRWAMTEGPFDGCDLDGASVQDKAEALGLIVKEPYDPAKHGEEHLSIMEPGQDLFVFAPHVDAVG